MQMQAGRKPYALLLCLVMALSLCLAPALADDAASPRLEDDFYAYINADWLAQAEIRADRSSVSAFSDAYDNVIQTLMADFDALLASGEETGDALLDMFIAYYAMVKDMDARNEAGFAPLADDYARIEGLQSLEDLSAQAASWMLDGMPLPFGLYVGKDPEDVTRYGMSAGMASSFLVNPEYYDPDNQIGQIILPLFQNTFLELFLAAGATEAEAVAEVEQAFAFDALLVSKMPSLEQQNDASFMTNLVPFDEFAAYSENIDLGALAEALVGARPDRINVATVDFFAAIDEIYAPENLDILKSWMKAQLLFGAYDLLSDDFATPVQTFFMLISGAQALPDPDETAYSTAYAMFDDVIGKYYGETYFGPEAKADVTGIVEDAIAIYRTRLEENDWLGEETRAMALRKLDAMSIRVGYPDALPAYYALYEVIPAADGGTPYGNAVAIGRAVRLGEYAKFGTTPDRSEWITTGDTVNAFYNPTDNSINFPAGILQAPFYAPAQSHSANLGGIGVVIGHEISHAFDTNGALYDEAGNMNNWWTDEDFAAFQARAEAMVALFDGLPYAGHTVNGRLTLGENIADAGGISSMLALVDTLPDGSLSDFFEAYATIWRAKTTPEEEALSLSDVHAPDILRVNIQCGNADAFYGVYGIEETDGMYIAPEARVNIW